MKNIILLIIACIVIYFLYIKFSGMSDETIFSGGIENPVYAEMRVNMHIANRDFKAVLYAKMTSQNDCEKRGKRVTRNMLKKCKFCEIQSIKCSPTTTDRVISLFNEQSDFITYASMKHGNSSERDGSIIVWGASVPESKVICAALIKSVKKTYSGTARCIDP